MKKRALFIVSIGAIVFVSLGAGPSRREAAPVKTAPAFSARTFIERDRAVGEAADRRVVPDRFFDDGFLLRVARARAPKVATDVKAAQAATAVFTGTVSAITLLRQMLPANWSLGARGVTGVRARGLWACHPSQAVSCLVPDGPGPLFVR